MFSNSLQVWDDVTLLKAPEQPWEFIQMGNCGPPICTRDGWLILTHGVGPMRRYCIGALLLDKKDPTKIISCLKLFNGPI